MAFVKGAKEKALVARKSYINRCEKGVYYGSKSKINN